MRVAHSVVRMQEEDAVTGAPRGQNVHHEAAAPVQAAAAPAAGPQAGAAAPAAAKPGEAQALEAALKGFRV